MKRFQAALALTVLALFAGTSATAEIVPAQPPQHVYLNLPDSVPNSGTVAVNENTPNYVPAIVGADICDASGSPCLSTYKRYTHDCYASGTWADRLSFTPKENNPNLGQISLNSASSFTYRLTRPGTYVFHFLSIEHDLSNLGNDNVNCGKTDLTKQVTVQALPKLDSSDPSFASAAANYNFSVSSYSCTPGENKILLPGDNVKCTYSVAATPATQGSVPVTAQAYVDHTNAGTPTIKIISTTSQSLGTSKTFTFKVPSNDDTIYGVTFGIWVAGYNSSYASTKYDVAQPSKALKVTISGPSRVIRGKAFNISLLSSPRVTGFCSLTSNPDAAHEGDLGRVRLVNGVAHANVSLLWPKSLGDGFSVGISAACTAGKRSSYSVFSAMGYLP